MTEPQKADLIEVTGLGADGDGIVVTERGSEFVQRALPGERIRRVADGDIEIVVPSPERRTARLCPHFPACGGCAVQHMGDALHRRWKEGLLAEALQRAGIDAPLAPMIAAPLASRRRATLATVRIGGAIRIGFHRARISDAESSAELQSLTRLLWSLRVEEGLAREFVAALRAGMLDGLMAAEPSLADQREQVDRMSAALAFGGPLADLDLASLGGRDGSPLHLNLLTLHSAKGREFDVVIMIGLDLGSLPWRNELPAARRESRRLFYVGLTRARDEIHMLYSGYVETRSGRMYWGRSPFLNELEARMQEAEGN